MGAGTLAAALRAVGGERWPAVPVADEQAASRAHTGEQPPGARNRLRAATVADGDRSDRPGVELPGLTTRAQLSAAAAVAPPQLDLIPARPRPRARWSIPPRTALLALLALALVAGAAILRSVSAASGTPVDLAEPRATLSASAPTPAASSTPVLVHVVGQVANPGVVELPAQARVSEALNAAGGPLPDADLSALNLAAVVQDGAQIVVPAPGEAAPAAPSAAGAATSGLIDLNRASATELEELPGVGPVLAERIVADRESQGPFSSVDDLDRVSGIGPAVLANLRDRATV